MRNRTIKGNADGNEQPIGKGILRGLEF